MKTNKSHQELPAKKKIPSRVLSELKFFLQKTVLQWILWKKSNGSQFCESNGHCMEKFKSSKICCDYVNRRSPKRALARGSKETQTNRRFLADESLANEARAPRFHDSGAHVSPPWLIQHETWCLAGRCSILSGPLSLLYHPLPLFSPLIYPSPVYSPLWFFWGLASETFYVNVKSTVKRSLRQNARNPL